MEQNTHDQLRQNLLGNKILALATVDGALKRLNAQRPLTPTAVARLREEIKLESTYDSNAIEGSTLTLRETVLVVKEGVTVGNGKPIRDIFAAKGYADGFDAIFEFVDKERPCDEELIQNFNRYVMIGALPQYCGLWRDHDVRVVGAAFKPVSWELVPSKMRELVEWYNKEDCMHPIEKIAKFHAAFETIHPFADGNGRTGRLLLNYMLVREGYWPINIRYGEDRLNYYEALDAFRIKENADDLTSLIAMREVEQLTYCLKIALQQEKARQMNER